MATRNEDATGKKDEQVFASVESLEKESSAELDIDSFHYPDGDDDIQVTVTLDSMQIFVGLSPEQAAELRKDLSNALEKVDYEF